MADPRGSRPRKRSAAENYLIQQNPGMAAYLDLYDQRNDANFARAADWVLSDEGGYSNNKKDRGGETIYGLAKAPLEARRRQEAAEQGKPYRPLTKAEFLSMSRDDVMREYRGYWDRSGAGKLPFPLGYYHFDWAMQDSEVDAIKRLQQSVGASPDGFLGWETFNKVGAVPTEDALKAYDEARKRKRASRPPSEKSEFGGGWADRDQRALDRARALNQGQ